MLKLNRERNIAIKSLYYVNDIEAKKKLVTENVTNGRPMSISSSLYNYD